LIPSLTLRRYEMRIPGFTADAALPLSDQGPKAAGGVRKIALESLTTRHLQTITPQFVGGHFCYWRCYPGSGCEHVCRDFPY